MAGMLPGVHGVSQRKRMHLYNRQQNPSSHREPPLRERLDPSMISNTMDETALRARQRLEHKLGYLPSKIKPNEATKSSQNFSSKKIGRQWYFQVSRCKSHRKICAVCLEDFQADQQIMDLSCSHKYHSNCLLPWLALAAHPHCPYCRTPVKSLCYSSTQ